MSTENALVQNNTVPAMHDGLPTRTTRSGLIPDVMHPEGAAGDSDATERPAVKREHVVIDLDNEEDSEREYGHTNGVDRKRPRKETIQSRVLAAIQHLPIYVEFPTSDGGTDIREIEQLPVTVQTDLKGRYKNMWSSNHSRIERYHRILQKPLYYMRKGCCIRRLVTDHGRINDAPAYKQGRLLVNTADDRCTKVGEPCAHFVEQDGRIVICLVPLPRQFRDGKIWTEVGYWVVQGTD